MRGSVGWVSLRCVFHGKKKMPSVPLHCWMCCILCRYRLYILIHLTMFGIIYFWLDLVDLNIVRPPPGSGTVDSPRFPPALLRANRLCWVSFIQPRMLGERGLLHRPMSTWIFSACASLPRCEVWDLRLRLKASHTSTQLTLSTFLYLTSCNLFLYRRPFGTPALYPLVPLTYFCGH
jgi:hypothetical protein